MSPGPYSPRSAFVADKRLKRHAGHRQRFGKIQQAQNDRFHATMRSSWSKHGQAGVEQIQPGLHHLAKQPVGFWSGIKARDGPCGGCANRQCTPAGVWGGICLEIQDKFCRVQPQDVVLAIRMASAAFVHCKNL